MEYLRAIGTNNEETGIEEVTFTEDFDAPVEDFMREGDEVLYDEKIEDNFPSLFPRERSLRVTF